MHKHFIFGALTVFLAVTPFRAQAQTGSTGEVFYEVMFGNPDQRQAQRAAATTGTDPSSENCSGYGASFLAMMNSLFCTVEKTMGLKGTGSATKVFSGNGISTTVHVEMAATPTTINSITYANTMSAWVCYTNCTVPANFVRNVYVAYNYVSGSINQGYAMFAFSSPTNSSMTGALNLIYDVSASKSSQSVTATVYSFDGTNTYKMHSMGTKSANLFQYNMEGSVNVQGYPNTNFRMALSTTPVFTSAKPLNMYYEYTGASTNAATGIGALDGIGLTAPSTSAGACYSGAEAGSNLSVTAVSSSNCNALTFQAFDYSAAAAPSATAASGISAVNVGGSTGWNGMPAAPTAI